MPFNDEASLSDMDYAAELAQSFVTGMDWETFRSDIKTQSAVTYQIAVIGEAANRLSLEFQEKYPTIPWADIVGMRNRLVHDYGNIDPVRVWAVVQADLTELRKELSRLMK